MTSLSNVVALSELLLFCQLSSSTFALQLAADSLTLAVLLLTCFEQLDSFLDLLVSVLLRSDLTVFAGTLRHGTLME